MNANLFQALDVRPHSIASADLFLVLASGPRWLVLALEVTTLFLA